MKYSVVPLFLTDTLHNHEETDVREKPIRENSSDAFGFRNINFITFLKNLD
jgi:hypothetical protein